MRTINKAIAVVTGALACALAAALVTGPLLAAAATNPFSDRIVFVRGGDLWTCKRDGTSAKRITIGAADDYEPRWSTDHRRVIFIRRTATSDSIRSVAASGGPTTEILRGSEQTTEGISAGFTSLAPAPGGKSVYVGQVSREETIAVARVLKVNIASHAQSVVLTDTPSDTETGYYWLDVNADGKKLIFLERSGDSQDLKRYDLVTRKSKRLVGAGAGWSGRIGPSDKALCSTWVDYVRGALLLIKLDTTPLYALKTFDDPAKLPFAAVGFSPDATRLAYTRGSSLYVSTPDGSSTKRIATGLDAMDASADW
jgi:Tol biopolymer transport system component